MKQGISCDGVLRLPGTRYGYCIVKECHGFVDEQDFYAFVAIEPQNLDYFQKEYTPGEHTHFTPFGMELLRGWGTCPPEHIVKHVAEKYGVYFCRDEASARALAIMISHDLSDAQDNAVDKKTYKLAGSQETFIDFCRKTFEKPTRFSGC